MISLIIVPNHYRYGRYQYLVLGLGCEHEESRFSEIRWAYLLLPTFSMSQTLNNT